MRSRRVVDADSFTVSAQKPSMHSTSINPCKDRSKVPDPILLHSASTVDRWISSLRISLRALR
jgi:hypothetical protein